MGTNRRRSWACPCHKEQTVEVMHVLPRNVCRNESWQRSSDRSRSSRILKITQQVANTQDQLKIVSQERIQQRTVGQAVNTHAQEVLNAVEVKTLKANMKTMLGKKLDPDDDQSNKDQSGDQTGRDS